MQRKFKFAIGEYYHVYNRGSDHRDIIQNQQDSDRFLKSMLAFNTTQLVGSIYELSFAPETKDKGVPLVDVICYCINPNHFHLLLRQKVKDGVGRFIRSFVGGYSKYYNIRHKRSGTLFAGPYKAKHIIDNNHLLHLSVYINLNNIVHNISKKRNSLVRSSWDEYKLGVNGHCKKEIVLGQFSNINDYAKFARETLPSMLEKRPEYEELKTLMLE